MRIRCWCAAKSIEDGLEGIVERLRTRGDRELLLLVVVVPAAVDAPGGFCGEEGILLLAVQWVDVIDVLRSKATSDENAMHDVA